MASRSLSTFVSVLGTANKNTVKLEKTADGIKVELDSVVTSASGNKETFDIEDNITADEKGNYVYNNHGVSDLDPSNNSILLYCVVLEIRLISLVSSSISL